MRRSLFTLLLGLLVAVVAGCGTGGSGSGSAGAPEPGDLAADAVSAARSAGSGHYSVEATLERESGEPMRLRVEGDAGKGKGRADVTFQGDGQSLAGTLLYDGGAFFVRFLGKWYGDRSQMGRTDELERQFGTPDGIRERFGDLFEGSVTEGPVADGVPTWAFNGRLDVDGIMNLTPEEAPLEDHSRHQLEELGRTPDSRSSSAGPIICRARSS